MLQKILFQTLGAMATAGWLGMIAVYLICGKIDGDYVGFRSVLSPQRPIPECASLSPAETSGLRNKILAGGCAGVLLGLGLPAWSSRQK